MNRRLVPVQPYLERLERADDRAFYTWVATNPAGGQIAWGAFPGGSPEQASWAEDLCVILEMWLGLPEGSVTFDGERWWIEGES